MEQLLHRNVQRFRGGLVFEAHGLCVSLNSRLESNKEEEETSRNDLHLLHVDVAVGVDRPPVDVVSVQLLREAFVFTSQTCESVPRRARI